jgi:hypothetical protein
MIQPNELRIGNWVQHNGNWRYKGKTEPSNIIWGQIDWYSVVEGAMDLKDIDPIPLTEDLLLKCGFADYSDDGSKRIALIKDLEIKCPEYLHQLQNLYFALTGEELNVEL